VYQSIHLPKSVSPANEGKRLTSAMDVTRAKKLRGKLIFFIECDNVYILLNKPLKMVIKGKGKNNFFCGAI
jgi:hypothetical protein